MLALLAPGTPYNDSVGIRSIASERLPRKTGLLFDPLTAATVSADFTLRAVLHPARLGRLVSRSAEGGLEVSEVTDALLAATWDGDVPESRYEAEVLRTVRTVTLRRLMEAAEGHPMSPVRAILTDRLLDLAARLEENPQAGPHDRLSAAEIRRWENRPATTDAPASLPPTPPGSPIGGAQGW